MAKQLIRPYAKAQDTANPTDSVMLLAIQHRSPAVVGATVDYIMGVVMPMIEEQLPAIEAFEAKIRPFIDELTGAAPKGTTAAAVDAAARATEAKLETGAGKDEAAALIASIMLGANPGAGKLN